MLRIRLRAKQILLTLFVIASGLAVGFAVSKASWLYMGTLVFGVVTLLYPVQISLGCFGALVPFDNISGLNQNTSLTYFVGAAAGALLLATGLANGRLQVPPRAALWWTLLGFWGAISMLWALDQQITIHSLLSLFALLMLYSVTVSFRIAEQELNFIVALSIAGACGAGLFVVYEFLHGTFYHAASMRGSLIISGRETNPNYLAASFLVPMSLTIGSLLKTPRRMKKWLLYGTLVIIAAGLLVTMSRGGLLAAGTVILVYFYRYRRNWRKLSLIVALPIPLLFLMPSYFFLRWQQASTTGGAGRLDIWRAGLMALRGHLLWGVGLGDFPVAYNRVAGYASHFEGFSRDAHNTCLAIATELGIVGLLLFTAAVFSQFRAAGKARRSKVSALLVAAEAGFCAVLMAGMFGNLLWDKTFWFSSMLLMLISQVEKSRPSPSDQSCAYSGA
jgi:O-antigen ligase